MALSTYRFKALEDAEITCLRSISNTLGLRIGESAFVFANPARQDCAVFDIGFIEQGDEVAFPAHVFHFRGTLDLFHPSRAKLQEWIMRVMLTYPMSPHRGRSNELDLGTNVSTLRIAPTSNSVGAINLKMVGENLPTYSVSINMDVVFTTKEKE